MIAKLKRNKNIVYLWLGHFISHSGDSIYMLALPWLILDITGSKSETALVATSVYLPTLLFGLLSGSLVDFMSRRKLMIISDLLRAVTVLIIPLMLLNDIRSTFAIGTIAFIMSSFGTPFYPARDALIPHLVSKDKLPTVNSLISTSGQMSHLMGPVIAGALVGVVGLTHLFTIDAITFLVSLGFIWLVRIKEIIDVNQSDSYMQKIKGGFQYLREKKGVKILIIMTTFNNLFIMGPAIIGTPVFVRDVLKMDFAALAQLESAMAAGMLPGSLIIIRFLKNISPIKVLFFGILFDGITYSLLYGVDTRLFAMLVLFIHGIGIPLIIVSRTNLIQTIVPNDLRGRLFAMTNMAVLGTTAISTSLTGFVLEFVDVQRLFLIIGILAMCTALIGMFSKPFLSLNRINEQF